MHFSNWLVQIGGAKMANKNIVVNNATVQSIADAIRTKLNTTATYTPLQFVNAIRLLAPSGTKQITNTSTTNVEEFASAKITDSNLITANIKSGITILGVAGKSSVVDTADATAVASQIKKGKTAYINGTKVTGTGEIYVSGTVLYLPSGWVN